MRSSDDEVLRFLSQLKNKSISMSGSCGCLRGFFVAGTVHDATLQAFTVRLDALKDVGVSLTFDLSEGEFGKVVPSARGREAWTIRLPSDDILSVEEFR
jgi:hypothetical protein